MNEAYDFLLILVQNLYVTVYMQKMWANLIFYVINVITALDLFSELTKSLLKSIG